MSLSVGVDEAGRGPILGPMVLAAVALDDASAATLAAAGVADSKAFGSGLRAKQRRRELAAEIERRAAWVHTRIAHPVEIDARVERGELNHLEREMAAELLRRGPITAADRIICDGHRLFSPLARDFPGLVAQDRAEGAHLCVAAASIVAKNLRDVAFESIASKYEPQFGPLRGGGYPNAATRAFIEWHEVTFGRPPEEIRQSWGRPRTPTSRERESRSPGLDSPGTASPGSGSPEPR